MATVATKYISCRTIKYSLQLIKSLFGAACHKVVAIVKPCHNQAVDYRRCSDPGECASAALDAT